MLLLHFFHLPISHCNLTLSELLDLWRDEYLVKSSLAVGTMNNYCSVIRTLQSMHVSAKPVRRITENDLQLLADQLSYGYKDENGEFHKGYQNARLNAFGAVLRKAFHYGVHDLKMLKTNPMDSVEFHKQRRERDLFVEKDKNKKRPTITRAQYTWIVDHLRERGNPAALTIQIAYYTGLRLGEVCGITWQDVDFSHHRLTVRRAVAVNRMLDNRMEFTSPKRDKTRQVVFGEELKQILLSERERQQRMIKHGVWYYQNYYYAEMENGQVRYPLISLCEEDAKKCKRNLKQVDLVCVKGDGAYLSRKTVANVCYRLRRYRGLENFHFHQLRHTYATNLMNVGAKPKEIQELLGHSDISTTMNVYTHADRRRLTRLVRKLDEI